MVALSCNLNCKPLSAFVWLSKGIEAVYFKIARGHRMLRIVCSDSFDVDCVNLNLKKQFYRLTQTGSLRCGRKRASCKLLLALANELPTIRVSLLFHTNRVILISCREICSALRSYRTSFRPTEPAAFEPSHSNAVV